MRFKTFITHSIISLAACLIFPFFLQAQTHEFGIRGGLANYRGELAPVFNFASPGVHLGAFYRFNPNAVWSFKLGGTFSQINADDKNSLDAFAQARNHSFRTNIWEFGGQIEYNFLNFRQSIRTDLQDWTPYLLAGLGVYKMEPRLNIQPTYRTINPAAFLGVGLKAVLAERWNIGVELGARFAFTDYLDDLGIDTNIQSANNPRLYTGNPNQNDMYFFTAIVLSYVIPDPNKSCPIKLYR